MEWIVFIGYYIIYIYENSEMKPKKLIERHELFIFFTVALVLSWTIWIPMALDRLNLIQFKIPIIIGQSIGGLCPLFTLFFLDKISRGTIGAKAIFDQIQLKGEKKIWLFPAALLLPLLIITGNSINFLFEKEKQFIILKTEMLELYGYGLILIIPVLLLLLLFSSPLFEEPCWRGYGLGKLQNRLGKQAGSLLLGTYWWLWHQPINIANGMQVSVYSYLFMVSQSFIIDSLYNLSNKNLLSAMLAHSSLIVAYNFIYQLDNPYTLLVFACCLFTLRIIEWKKKEPSLNLKDQLL